MSGRTPLFATLLPSLLLATACASWRPPEFNRERVTIEVVNPFSRDLSVNINHVGGVWALGIVRAHEVRTFNIYLLQDQPVFVLAADLNSYQEMRQSVYLSAGCVTRVVLFNAPAAAPIAAATDDGSPRNSKSSAPSACSG